MIHHIFANKSNIGDWLSAIGIQQLLSPMPIVEHLCDEPFVAETLDELKGLTANDMIIIGGGGLFMDYFLPLWDGLNALQSPAKLVIWGVGYCDLKRAHSQPPIATLRRALGRASQCFVRDEITRELLGMPDLPAPSACPSLCAIEPSTPQAFGLLHVDNHDTAGADIYAVMDATAEAFANETGRVLRRTNNRIEPGRRDGLAKCLLAYEKSDLVLSSALHGCILSIAMGKKVLAVSGDWKIEGFMELLGLRGWVMSQEDAAEPGAVRDRLDRLADQRLDPARVESLRQTQRQIAAQVRSLVTSGAL